MIHGAAARFIEIPGGSAGSLAVLDIMAQHIVTPEPRVRALFDAMAATPGPWATMTDAELCAYLFEWVRTRCRYTPDATGHFQLGGRDFEISDEIRSPAYLLEEITRHGWTQGDCDDLVILLGALIVQGCGWPGTLVALSTRDDLDLNHVYLEVEVDGEPVACDPTVPAPLGWAVPEDERTAEVRRPL